MRATALLRRLYLASGARELLPQRLKAALRRAWVRVARAIGYPISSPLVPRPPLDRRRRPMRLSRVLLACDLNPDYLGFWPSTRRAWTEIVGVRPLLVLVAAPGLVPDDLRDDPDVVPFAPVEGLHTAFQAQCIRLLYPALVETGDAVLISDVDLYPLRPSYFHDPVARLDRNYFVTYRDTRLDRGQVNILFNAAVPATWGEIFGVSGLGDVSARLAEWGAGRAYDGRRGWEGWYSDQEILFEKLASWPEARARLWTLDDEYCGYRQLNRLELAREGGLEPGRRRELLAMEYSDYSCLVPYEEHRETNDLVLELALEAARRRSRGRRRAVSLA